MDGITIEAVNQQNQQEVKDSGSGCPCDDCADRKLFAKLFDFHMYGDDCVFDCPQYAQWKKEQLETQHDF